MGWATGETWFGSPNRQNIFLLSESKKFGSGARKAPYLTGTGSLPGVKLPERGVDQ